MQVQRMSRPIVMVTGNKKKLEEFKLILGSDLPVEVTSKDIDLPEFQGTPEEIAREKCKLAAQAIKGPVIVEDTSLCFNALGGMPGPYVKWFLQSVGTKGLHQMLHGFDDKTAYAQCVFAYSSGQKGAEVKIFDGRCPGSIVSPRGPKDFGWDPCFKPEGFDQTYAEMDKAVKNTISHRGKALELLKKFLIEQSS